MNALAEVRAFVALELDERLRESIGDLQKQLRPRLAGIRLVRPEGIHLTLRFLGPTSPAQLEKLGPLLAEAASFCPPADVRVARLGTFPDRGRPRVLWLGLKAGASILDLQRACERAARSVGFEREERPFTAHLTLGRWRGPAPRPDLPAVDLGTIRLERLVLFRSDLRPDGAVYTSLAGFALGMKEG